MTKRYFLASLALLALALMLVFAAFAVEERYAQGTAQTMGER